MIVVVLGWVAMLVHLVSIQRIKKHIKGICTFECFHQTQKSCVRPNIEQAPQR